MLVEQRLKERYNSDLASGLGNLVSRVLTMAEKDSVKMAKEPQALSEEIKAMQVFYEKAVVGFKFNEALDEIWRLISDCDKKIENERPWEDGKEEIISDLLCAISNVAIMLQPFLPETSEKIFTVQKKNRRTNGT